MESRKTGIHWLSLLLSASTLVCCALPAILVTVGLGASLASFVSVFPQIVWISQYKGYLFSLSFISLVFASISQKNQASSECSLEQKKACQSIKAKMPIILIVGWILWSTGFFFAYLAIHIL